MGPTWGRKSEEWAIHLSFSPNTIPALTEEALASTIRKLLKLPSLELNILKIADWSLERVVAHKYSMGIPL